MQWTPAMMNRMETMEPREHSRHADKLQSADFVPYLNHASASTGRGGADRPGTGEHTEMARHRNPKRESHLLCIFSAGQFSISRPEYLRSRA